MASKRMMTLARIRYAGYHEDYSSFLTNYVEGRISFTVAIAEYRAGIQARKAGVKCTCPDCNPPTTPGKEN